MKKELIEKFMKEYKVDNILDSTLLDDYIHVNCEVIDQNFLDTYQNPSYKTYIRRVDRSRYPNTMGLRLSTCINTKDDFYHYIMAVHKTRKNFAKDDFESFLNSVFRNSNNKEEKKKAFLEAALEYPVILGLIRKNWLLVNFPEVQKDYFDTEFIAKNFSKIYDVDKRIKVIKSLKSVTIEIDNNSNTIFEFKDGTTIKTRVKCTENNFSFLFHSKVADAKNINFVLAKEEVIFNNNYNIHELKTFLFKNKRWNTPEEKNILLAKLFEVDPIIAHKVLLNYTDKLINVPTALLSSHRNNINLFNISWLNETHKKWVRNNFNNMLNSIKNLNGSYIPTLIEEYDEKINEVLVREVPELISEIRDYMLDVNTDSIKIIKNNINIDILSNNDRIEIFKEILRYYSNETEMENILSVFIFNTLKKKIDSGLDFIEYVNIIQDEEFAPAFGKFLHNYENNKSEFISMVKILFKDMVDYADSYGELETMDLI